MDNGVYIFTGIVALVIAAVVALLAFLFFRRFKKLNDLLNSALDMTGTAEGTISSLTQVRRRNRSFRWTNEYPVITYTVDGRPYNVNLDYAEKRAGHYSVGGSYRVCYKPSDPSCCIVDEFRKPLSRVRTQNLVIMVVLALITLNAVFTGISAILGAFI
ncbi:MAG: DUF3592 domain-containing protein [Roseburia sp.]|nr:DUF3592 domain-containing protein [Roseburia sp.]